MSYVFCKRVWQKVTLQQIWRCVFGKSKLQLLNGVQFEVPESRID